MKFPSLPLRPWSKFLISTLCSSAYEYSFLELKKKFWETGFATYEDIEYLSGKLLQENPAIASHLAKRYPLIIVDECQDLSFSQLQILNALHEHSAKLHFVGDLDQSIYKFCNIDPSKSKSFIGQLRMKELPLAENYSRCG